MARCFECGHEMAERTISREFNKKMVCGIKASVCENCGAIYIPTEEAHRIEKAVKSNV